MKKVLLLSVFITFIYSCSSVRSTNQSYNATLNSSTFDFTPPDDHTNDPDKITFLFINPRFSTGVSQSYQMKNPFRTFLKNMSVDFVEMLVAKGMPFKGPYESYEETVFSDKNESDLCIESEVDIQFTGSAYHSKPALYNAYGNRVRKAQYYYDGNVTLIGKLNLYIYEPHTHVKLWIKSIPLKTKEFYLKSQYKYDGPDIPLEDPGIWDVLVYNLDEMYKSTMNTAWKQLDMRELKMRKEEAKKIAEKAGYGRRN